MIAHTHVLQGKTDGCPACDGIRPESQVHPYAVPPLPAAYVPTSFEPEEDDDEVDPEVPAHVAALPEATHRIVDERPVCDGGIGHKCHWYPEGDCDHESFPCGHEYVFHEECWVMTWLTAVDLIDTAEDSAADARIEVGDDLRWPNGVIEHEWDPDYVTWRYVSIDTEAVPEPVLPDGRRESDMPLW